MSKFWYTGMGVSLSLSKYNAHTEPIFNELKLLKVKDILWL